jgi:hypothetical protein
MKSYLKHNYSKKKVGAGPGGMAQVVECLPSKHEAVYNT